MLPERRLLQAAVALACIVPLSAGLFGMINGAAFLGGGSADLDSHVRYLSGLLFSIGLCFATAIPKIEKHSQRFRLLTFIVVMGGLARLAGLAIEEPGAAMRAALVMELVVTPSLCLWQHRIAKRYLSSITSVD